MIGRCHNCQHLPELIEDDDGYYYVACPCGECTAHYVTKAQAEAAWRFCNSDVLEYDND